MKKIATNLGKYFKLPNPGLWAFLERNVKGQPDDYETGLFNGKSMEQILAGFEVKDVVPGLLDFENELRSKVGPMSVMAPFSERQEKVEEYYQLVHRESVPISEAAIKAVVDEWKSIKGIRRASRQSTIKLMRLNTNSGSPFFAKRYTVVSNEDETKQYSAAAVLGWRGQEGGPDKDDTKQRVVWMFPFEVNVQELSVYKPIIAGLQKHKLVPALVSMDEVDRRMTLLFDTKRPTDLVVGTDFKGYDQTFNKNAQDCTRKVWDGLGVEKTWLDSVYPIKFNIPIVCTEDVTYEDEHGMGSGSGGTNTDECAEHRALQHEAAQENSQTLNPNSQAYGDDGVISYPGITVDQVIKAYTKHGHVMNATKQYAHETRTTYLRRFYSTEWRVDGIMRGVYSIYRALGRLRKQERFYDPEKWNANMVVLRSLSIIENCKWHPQFEELIEYVLANDKYRLGLSVEGFYGVKQLSKMAKEAQEALGEDFLGYTKSAMSDEGKTDINDWFVVKYLRKKSQG